MNAIQAQPNAVIHIGRLGENIYTLVQFDISEYLAQYPNATAILLNMRPGDTSAYPVANIATDEQYLYWTVADNDLTVKGMGYCELVIMDGEMVAKSIIYPTQIMDALDGSGDEPADWDTWLSQFETLASQAMSSASAAAASEASAASSASTATEAAGNASQSESSASASAESASESATSASASSTLSESWAVGGTGTRPGEDTNNAKFWSEMAQQHAADSGWALFDIDDQTGQMIVIVSDDLSQDVTFAINENTGELEVTVI